MSTRQTADPRDVRAARKSAGMTAAQAAAQLGVTPSTWYHWESTAASSRRMPYTLFVMFELVTDQHASKHIAPGPGKYRNPADRPGPPAVKARPPKPVPQDIPVVDDPMAELQRMLGGAPDEPVAPEPLPAVDPDMRDIFNRAFGDE